MTQPELKKFIQKTAAKLGFSHVGISSATHDNITIKHLDQWLNNGYHASMEWMKIRSGERSEICQYFPEIKSVISLSMNYFTGNTSHNDNIGKISNYAWGDDYHMIIKPRLNDLLHTIKSKIPDTNGVVCIDTSPIMEKSWAQKGGLGWIGKHTNLITRDYGSWIFLGEILLDIELEYDKPFIEDLCGSCTACLDACPTNAFPEPYVLDSSKCISYLTIEHRGNLPVEMENKLYGWIYGCDICQEVCPWNIKFNRISEEIAFQPRSNLQERSLNDWSQLTQEEFKVLFKNSAIKRTKFTGLKRNINALRKSMNESSETY